LGWLAHSEIREKRPYYSTDSMRNQSKQIDRQYFVIGLLEKETSVEFVDASGVKLTRN